MFLNVIHFTDHPLNEQLLCIYTLPFSTHTLASCILGSSHPKKNIVLTNGTQGGSFTADCLWQICAICVCNIFCSDVPGIAILFSFLKFKPIGKLLTETKYELLGSTTTLSNENVHYKTKGKNKIPLNTIHKCKL